MRQATSDQDLRHIVTICGDILLMLDQFIAHRLLDVDRKIAKFGHAIDHVLHQVETIQIVSHHHVERRGGGALFFIAADVEVLVVRPAVGEAVD